VNRDLDAAGIAHGVPWNARAGPRVLMTPDYRKDNPYQHLLADALENLGASVRFPTGYRRVFPLRRMLPRSGPRPDILHLHWIAPYLKGKTAVAKAIYAVKLLVDLTLVQRAGVKLIWTIHNLVDHEQAHPGIELWLRRRLAALADGMIVHSEEARELVAATYRLRTHNINVIPHGHYRDAYGPPMAANRARDQLGLPTDRHVFLFFGMIRPYKGFATLLSAWAKSPDLQRHALVIAGRPHDEACRRRIEAAAAAADGIHLHLGHIPDAQVPLYFSAADTVVLPLERALTSGSLVLAHTFGCRVVTTLSKGGTREPALPEHGDSIKSSDLARRLMSALDAEGAARSPEYPNWDSIARQHLNTMLFARRP